jgi:DNA-binding FadR family transcriptional regulator
VSGLRADVIRIPLPEPIPRRKLYREVLARVTERIRSGEIPSGAQLPSERELMTFYGVGRPAVREALQSLARSGIVEITHGVRARVVIPTAGRLIEQTAGGARHLLPSQPDTLEHMKDARVFMEVGIARLAAERAIPADVPRPRERLVEQHASLVDLDDLDDLVTHDTAFSPRDCRHQRRPDPPGVRRCLVRLGQRIPPAHRARAVPKR